MKEPKEILKKLNGYHGIGRGIFLLLHNQVLTKEEFILYLASLIIGNWDKDKKNSYGMIDITQEEIEWLLKAPAGYVSKLKEKLTQKGFWRTTESKKIRVVGFELTETSLLSKITKDNKIVDYQKYIAQKQNEFALEQKEFASKQASLPKETTPNQPQKFAPEQTTSSKSDISSYKDGSISLRSDEEYQKIIKEMGYSLLTVDDLKWIDLNIHEDPAVPS